MEQNNNMDGGEHVHHVTQEPTRKESWDERVIRQGIEEALHEDRNIDDRTARYIASQLHGGQDSALYSLASTGNIPPDIHDELTRDFDQQNDEVKNWINWLGTYCMGRADKGPVPGWAEQAAQQDRADQEHEWLDYLFGETPDEDLGSVDELGWFGLMRHQGRPGGIVLHQDEQGFRHLWEADSNEELEERWSTVSNEYSRFNDEREARERAEDERAARTQGELGSTAIADDLAVSTPALNALVASGVILEDDIYQELYADMDGQSSEIRKLVDALQGYCIRRADKGPVARWGRDDAERDTPSGVKPEIWVGSLRTGCHHRRKLRFGIVRLRGWGHRAVQVGRLW